MSIAANLIADIKYEAPLARKTLERIPFDHKDWRPHAKSFNLQQLSSHLADIPSWIYGIVTEVEWDEKPGTVYFSANSTAELLAHFDESLAKGLSVLAKATDADLQQQWTYKWDGNPVVSASRFEMINGFVVKHLIHHRAQLGVYLRLLDIPVPSIYGPSADEQM